MELDDIKRMLQEFAERTQSEDGSMHYYYSKKDHMFVFNVVNMDFEGVQMAALSILYRLNQLEQSRKPKKYNNPLLNICEN